MLLNAINFVLRRFGFVMIPWFEMNAVIDKDARLRLERELTANRDIFQSDVCEHFEYMRIANKPPEKKVVELADKIEDFDIDVPVERFLMFPTMPVTK